ncbi:hypothetical protein CFBP4996_19660 [Agrobacterium leguminum]|uniref:Cupin 2 conserved barrel domain-containing protein n=1 Tax=Agrobacterium deltaense NCPPB 1641 TaxID=1183425 RepID=A0A1S7TW59_9HYPH|nr:MULTISPECIES: hypothetical protein [Agrobacterium]WFS68234.1 hypothetical protein CFBP4996_19660 [Agrobacterium leguminum]CVI58804.1 hypothetical protein AGR7A_Lc120265 [Agrobacterium deltaense NCPPB 1641]
MSDFTSKLKFDNIVPGLDLATYISGPVEVQVVKVKSGAEIPLHKHTDDVVHLILEGEITFSDGGTVGPLADYRCGRFEYQGVAKSDTTMLIIQPVGTTFEFIDKPLAD